jgi:hypothetical protein
MPVMQKVPYYNNLRKLNLSSISRCWAIVTDAKKTMIILFEETNLFINFRATSSGSNCSKWHRGLWNGLISFFNFNFLFTFIFKMSLLFHLFLCVTFSCPYPCIWLHQHICTDPTLGNGDGSQGISHRESFSYSPPRDACGSYVCFSPGNRHHYPVLGRYIYADVTICMDMGTKTLHKGRDEIIKTL